MKPEEQPVNPIGVGVFMIAVIALVLYAIWPRNYEKSARDIAIYDCMNSFGDRGTAQERLVACKRINK